MKISIALSLFILALGATFGWQDHHRLAVVRVTHDRTVPCIWGTGWSDSS